MKLNQQTLPSANKINNLMELRNLYNADIYTTQ